MKNFAGKPQRLGPQVPLSAHHELHRSSLQFYLGFKHRNFYVSVVKVHKYRLTFKYSSEISEDSVLPCGLVRDGAVFCTEHPCRAVWYGKGRFSVPNLPAVLFGTAKAAFLYGTSPPCCLVRQRPLSCTEPPRRAVWYGRGRFSVPNLPAVWFGTAEAAFLYETSPPCGLVRQRPLLCTERIYISGGAAGRRGQKYVAGKARPERHGWKDWTAWRDGGCHQSFALPRRT